MKKIQAQVLSIVLIVAVPMLISWAMYFFHAQLHLKTTNYGTLLQPPVTVAALTPVTPHTWQIVFAPKACVTPDDEDTMFKLHQLRKALDKDRDRVALTLLTTPQCSLSDTHDFRAVSLTEKDSTAFTNKIYLVDPIGNVFMSYPLDADPTKILKDIKHLLGASQIG